MKSPILIIVLIATMFITKHTLAFQQKVSENVHLSDLISCNSYTEIHPKQVVSKIKKVVHRQFPNAIIAIAYLDREGTYKLVLTVDKDIFTVYINTKGEWIEPNELK
ncbi:hypothetical protein [Aquimarina rhabdastrellae]